MSKKVGNWSDPDDAKLAQLFRQKKISSTDLSRDAIKKANAHFPDRDPKNFNPLFKGKCAQWNLNKFLTGRRKKSKFPVCLISNAASIHCLTVAVVQSFSEAQESWIHRPRTRIITRTKRKRTLTCQTLSSASASST